MTTSDRHSPVAVITGAGSGIGRATAVLLANAGYTLALVGRRPEPLEETRGLLRRGAPNHEIIVADVGDLSAAQGAIDQVTRLFGRIDVLVNNAGVAPLLSIDQTTLQTIRECFAVNAMGPAAMIARAWPVFTRQRSGVIVNVSTMGTADPFPGFFAYASSKASVNLMAVSCAKEGAPIGVRAFAVAPGAVETPMLRKLFGPSVIPAERCLTPEAVARVIVDCIAGKRDEDNGKTIFLSSP